MMLSPYTKDLNSVAVDFDGTIYFNGRIDYKAVKYLKKISELGIDLVLWTARDEERYDKAYNICRSLGLDVKHPPEATNKIHCLYYIDDRSVPGGKINWIATYRYIKKEVAALRRYRQSLFDEYSKNSLS